MARDVANVGLHATDERIADVDGALWIRNQLELHGMVDWIGLDFHHFSEHVHTARRKAFGEDNAEGSAGATELLHCIKHEGCSPAWQMAIECRSHATGSWRAEMARLLGYISERREMIGYRCEAISVAVFVQQLASGYLPHGHPDVWRIESTLKRTIRDRPWWSLSLPSSRLKSPTRKGSEFLHRNAL